MIIPIIVLAIVFLSIAYRRGAGSRFEIWQIMTLGALAVLLTGQISPNGVLDAIDFDVLIFLFGMFVIGEALEESGYLSHLAFRLFRHARSTDQLLLLMLFGFGLLSSVLMNDTIAIIGTPVVLHLSRNNGLPSKPMLIVLAFSITLGSVISPIGNPQNLIVALGTGMEGPFVVFIRYLAVPTIINLFLAFVLIRSFYCTNFSAKRDVCCCKGKISDPRLALLSKASLLSVLILILLKISMMLIGKGPEIELTYISIISAMPIILLSKKRIGVLKGVDWHTLVFFASMFVLMQSVWDTGFFQTIIIDHGIDMGSVPSIFLISTSVSQFISNVPLVALYVPILTAIGASTKAFISLACGSTIAGNLLVLGAASNIIIIQNAEKRGAECFNFKEFAKIGIPMTMLNIAVYMLFIYILP